MNISTLNTSNGRLGLIQGAALILTMGLPWAAAEDTSSVVGLFPLMWQVLSDGAQADLAAMVAFGLMAAVIIGAGVHMMTRMNGQSGILSSALTLAACVGLLFSSSLEQPGAGWFLTTLVAAVEPGKMLVSAVLRSPQGKAVMTKLAAQRMAASN